MYHVTPHMHRQFCIYVNTDKFDVKPLGSTIQCTQIKLKINKMKAKDWQTATKLIRERQSQATTADSSQLSSFPLIELPLDDSESPTVLQGPYVPLSMITPVCVPQDNQQTTDSASDESPFQQVIPSISQQSLYPSLAVMGTSVNTVVSQSITFARKVINDIEEQQRKTLKDTVEGKIRSINTSLTPEEEEKEE